jgi:hypothetical protein
MQAAIAKFDFIAIICSSTCLYIYIEGVFVVDRDDPQPPVSVGGTRGRSFIAAARPDRLVVTLVGRVGSTLLGGGNAGLLLGLLSFSHGQIHLAAESTSDFGSQVRISVRISWSKVIEVGRWREELG